jgi:hypothetical protein
LNQFSSKEEWKGVFSYLFFQHQHHEKKFQYLKLINFKLRISINFNKLIWNLKLICIIFKKSNLKFNSIQFNWIWLNSNSIKFKFKQNLNSISTIYSPQRLRSFSLSFEESRPPIHSNGFDLSSPASQDESRPLKFQRLRCFRHQRRWI